MDASHGVALCRKGDVMVSGRRVLQHSASAFAFERVASWMSNVSLASHTSARHTATLLVRSRPTWLFCISATRLVGLPHRRPSPWCEREPEFRVSEFQRTVTQRTRMTGKLIQLTHHTKTVVVVAEIGSVPVAVRGTGELGVAEPGPAPNHAGRAGGRATRISNW